jgi:hypothetical protein
MSSRGASLFVVLGAIAIGGCGNYSNDDLDFQLALPQPSDMEAKMQLSVTRPDSAEYYRATRSAIATFNGLVATLTGLIDVVRGSVPSSRRGDQRIWGPWAADQEGWEVRVVMQRSAASGTELRMDYSLQVRPQGAGDTAWVEFLTGWYESTGAVATGSGEVHLLVADARSAGFPVDQDPGLAELVRVDIAYHRGSFPAQVSLYIGKDAAAATGSGLLVYQQDQDGSGQLTFDWEVKGDAGGTITARMASRWIGSGAGRTDLTTELSGVETTIGIDC